MYAHYEDQDRRGVLRPFKNQRLAFEGVLIHIIMPNKKNGYTHGLVFASLYAQAQDVEIDHAVIKINAAEYAIMRNKLELYKRYKFTAKIEDYYKVGHIMGIPAKQKHYMLVNINAYKMDVLEEPSGLMQPTLYTRTRIRNLMAYKGHQKYNEKQLLSDISLMPNDGSVERYLNNCTRDYQKSAVNYLDILDILY